MSLGNILQRTLIGDYAASAIAHITGEGFLAELKRVRLVIGQVSDRHKPVVAAKPYSKSLEPLHRINPVPNL